MFVSINWIKEYVDLSGLDIEKLIGSFTLATAEVEDVFYKGRDIENVVIGQILTVKDHPENEKFKKPIHLLTVDAGDKVCNIVCAAPNVREGMKIPLALAGGRVPGGEITKAKVYGYESEGMCCSAYELGLSDDKSGLMELPEDAPVGKNIKDVYPVEDIVFEVDNKSLTNRPDLWGHYGIAREFAALTGRELKPLDLACTDYDGSEKIDVKVGREDLVYRYACIKMSNITVNVSPVAMQIRLYYCGMRPINLLADVTNYIMLEIGQPTHAFDANKIDNIVVTTPDEPLKFTTLDGVERNIDTDTLMIWNGSTPVAIAGIMGGLDSEIVGTTDSVILESANFSGVSVRKSASRLNHRTDASARDEKMLDPELVMLAVKRFVKLVKDSDPGAQVASLVTDEYVSHYEHITITFDKAYVDRYTGIDISNERIINTLTALGFGVAFENGIFTVDVPSWRATKDVTMKADIIEEITRIYGYDNFLISTTRSPLKPVRISKEKNEDYEVKDILVKKYSFNEVHSYVWCDGKKYKKLGIDVEDNVKVINIDNPDNSVLRNSMIPAMLVAVSENKDFADTFGVFEIGRVVNGTGADGMCVEEKHLGAVFYSKTLDEKTVYLKGVEIVNCLVSLIKQKSAEYSKIDVLHNWQHPKNTASVSVDGVCVGTINTLYPSNRVKIDKNAAVVCIEINMDAFTNIPAASIEFAEPSVQQATYYDLSLVVPDDVRYSHIENAWKALKIEELESVKMIDLFDRANLKSITLRVNFSSHDRTIGMDEVQAWIDKIVENLSFIGVVLRA